MKVTAKKCKKPECDKPKRKRPGNTSMYFPFCTDHQIEANLSKIRETKAKDTEGLETMRKTYNKRTPRERFYSNAAWKNFSHYVLLYYADDSLMVRCSTNPLLEYKVNDKMVCVGHWIKVFDANSSNYSTAYEFFNVGPQSVQENIQKSGNESEMEKWIEREHGDGTCDELRRKKHEPFKLDKYTLNLISKKYLKLTKELLIERNIQNPWKT